MVISGNHSWRNKSKKYKDPRSLAHGPRLRKQGRGCLLKQEVTWGTRWDTYTHTHTHAGTQSCPGSPRTHVQKAADWTQALLYSHFPACLFMQTQRGPTSGVCPSHTNSQTHTQLHCVVVCVRMCVCVLPLSMGVRGERSVTSEPPEVHTKP